MKHSYRLVTGMRLESSKWNGPMTAALQMRVSGSKGKWGAYTNVLLPVEKQDQTAVAISTCKELGVPQGSNERGSNPEKKFAVFRVSMCSVLSFTSNTILNQTLMGKPVGV